MVRLKLETIGTKFTKADILPLENVIAEACQEGFVYDPDNPTARCTAVESYCQAICFLLEMHPDGRYANMEDTQFWVEDSALFWNINSSQISVLDFLMWFVTSNISGDGTPLYVSDKKDEPI